MASVRKRDPRDPESPWVVEYTDPVSGKRKRATPKTGLKKDAEKLRQRIEREIQDRQHIPASETVTVKQLAGMYSEHCDSRVADRQIGVARREKLRHHMAHIVRVIGNVKLSELTTVDVETLYRAMRSGGQNIHTAKTTTSTLKLMQDYAIKRGLMVKTPATEALKDLAGGKGDRIKTFTMDEVSRLLAAVKVRKSNGRYRAHLMGQCIINIAAFCGLRFGEIIGLTASNIDLNRRVIRVRQSYCKVAKTLKAPKTRAGVRDVPMPPHLVALMRDWMDRGFTSNPADLVFASERGTVYAQANFHKDLWVPLQKAAGLHVSGEGYRFHALRHFAASWMIENGMALTDVAALLGHSKFDMTLQVYAHPVTDERRRHEAIAAMAERMLALPPTLELVATATELHPAHA